MNLKALVQFPAVARKVQFLGFRIPLTSVFVGIVIGREELREATI